MGMTGIQKISLGTNKVFATSRWWNLRVLPGATVIFSIPYGDLGFIIEKISQGPRMPNPRPRQAEGTPEGKRLMAKAKNL